MSPTVHSTNYCNVNSDFVNRQSGTDLRLSFQGKQDIRSVILRYTGISTGKPVQVLTRDLGVAFSTQMLDWTNLVPGHQTLIVVAVEQSHSNPGERCHQGCGVDLEEDCHGNSQPLTAAQIGPAMAQTCQQLPRLLIQDVTQQQQSQTGYQQEHQTVYEVQLIAGTTEHHWGENLLPSCCQQGQQSKTKVGLFVGNVQNHPKLIHLWLLRQRDRLHFNWNTFSSTSFHLTFENTHIPTPSKNHSHPEMSVQFC